MPLLRREDGVTFVLQPYRETLTIKNTSLLRKEAQYLAEAHGSNVRLFKQKSGDYEAAFSQDSGYLLGETIWAHFSMPDNLVYCEVLSDVAQEALLVVVREGKVYLDAKLSFDALADEIAGLFTNEASHYLVYTYGDLPISFEHLVLKSKTELNSSLFKDIPYNERFKLVLLEQALAEHHLDTKKRSSLIAATITCLLLLGGLWWYVHQTEVKPTVTLNPYEQYELALQTPDPGRQIDALLKGLLQIRGIKGWYPESVNYTGELTTVTMRSLGGTATGLLMSAEALNMSAGFSAEGATVTFSTVISGRAAPDHIAPVQQVVALVIDRMMAVLPGKSVQIGTTKTNQVFSQTNLTISFEGISPQTLQLIGAKLNELPVSLINCTLTLKDGLFSGSIQLAVVGK